MVRVFVVYEQEPERSATSEHADSAGKCLAGRSGTARFLGRRWARHSSRTTPNGSSPTWTPFRRPLASEEFMATGKDAMEMGGPSTCSSPT